MTADIIGSASGKSMGEYNTHKKNDRLVTENQETKIF